MSKKVKTIVIVIAVLAVICVGVCIAGEMYVNAAPERHIKGNWEGVASFQNSKFEKIEAGSLKMTIDRKGEAVYDFDTETKVYDWEKTSGYYSDKHGYEYELTASGADSATIFSRTRDALLFCQQYDNGAVKTTLFVKEGTDVVIDEHTDFDALLDMDLEELGITFISDRQALEYIQGEWLSFKKYDYDGTTYELDFDTVIVTVDGDGYAIQSFFLEDAEGQVEFTGVAENLYLYKLDGEYEGLDFLYNDEDKSLILYEEEAREGVHFFKNEF